MKRVLPLLFAGLIAGAAFSDSPFGTMVGSTNTVLLPDLAATPIAWTNGIAVTAGDQFAITKRTYLAVTGGSSTDMPTHAQGLATNLDGIVWRKYTRAPRATIEIVNESVMDVYLAVGAPAVPHRGILLKANGGSWSPGVVPQSSINAITAAGAATNTVCGQDW